MKSDQIVTIAVIRSEGKIGTKINLCNTNVVYSDVKKIRNWLEQHDDFRGLTVVNVSEDARDFELSSYETCVKVIQLISDCYWSRGEMVVPVGLIPLIDKSLDEINFLEYLMIKTYVGNRIYYQLFEKQWNTKQRPYSTVREAILADDQALLSVSGFGRALLRDFKHNVKYFREEL